MILFTTTTIKAQQIFVPESLCCTQYWELKANVDTLAGAYEARIENLSEQVLLQKRKVGLLETLIRSDSLLSVQAQQAVLEQVAETRIQQGRAEKAENTALELRTELDRIKGRGFFGRVGKGLKIAIPAVVVGLGTGFYFGTK